MSGQPFLDSSDVMFWCASNWPGGRAPCQWRIRPRDLSRDLFPEPGYWCYVSLWVPFGGRPSDGGEDLWSESESARDLEDAVATCKRLDAKLRAERDAMLDVQAQLDADRSEFMAGLS